MFYLLEQKRAFIIRDYNAHTHTLAATIRTRDLRELIRSEKIDLETRKELLRTDTSAVITKSVKIRLFPHFEDQNKI